MSNIRGALDALMRSSNAFGEALVSDRRGGIVEANRRAGEAVQMREHILGYVAELEEQTRVLAESTIRGCYDARDMTFYEPSNENWKCRYCEVTRAYLDEFDHDADCPVLLAQKILGEAGK